MARVRLRTAFFVLVSAASLLAPLAAAARPPTLPEREAITRALPAYLRNTPIECVWLDVSVSRNPRYALVAPVSLNATTPGSRCIRYAGNGFYVLKKARRWRVVYEGSVEPPCKLGVPRDLVRCFAAP